MVLFVFEDLDGIWMGHTNMKMECVTIETTHLREKKCSSSYLEPAGTSRQRMSWETKNLQIFFKKSMHSAGCPVVHNVFRIHVTIKAYKFYDRDHRNVDIVLCSLSTSFTAELPL